MEIRAAHPEDEDALDALDRANWTTLSSPAPPPPPGRRFFDRAPVDDVLVADDDGALAGFLQLGHGFDVPAHAHVLTIDGLLVDPERRGRGIGRTLVDAAAREARRRGARRLTLRVLAPNTAARRVYEACGFTVEGVLREEFLLDGAYADDVLMALAL